MTSANVIEYDIELDGKTVGHHRENILCKDHFVDLLKFEPYDKHTITAYGLDEEEESWEDKPQSLLEFLKHQAKSNKVIREKLATQGIIVQSTQEWLAKNKDKIKKHLAREEKKNKE